MSQSFYREFTHDPPSLNVTPCLSIVPLSLLRNWHSLMLKNDLFLDFLCHRCHYFWKISTSLGLIRTSILRNPPQWTTQNFYSEIFNKVFQRKKNFKKSRPFCLYLFFLPIYIHVGFILKLVSESIFPFCFLMKFIAF